MSKRTHRSGGRSAHRLETILLEQLQSYIREVADPALEGDLVRPLVRLEPMVVLKG